MQQLSPTQQFEQLFCSKLKLFYPNIFHSLVGHNEFVYQCLESRVFQGTFVRWVDSNVHRSVYQLNHNDSELINPLMTGHIAIWVKI